jgi:hypothetical protein
MWTDVLLVVLVWLLSFPPLVILGHLMINGVWEKRQRK